MELKLPWFFRQPQNQLRARLLRIRASQLQGCECSRGSDCSQSIDAVCDLVFEEFKKNGYPLAGRADQIVKASVDLMVQLEVIRPPKPRILLREAAKIMGGRFPKAEISDLRARLLNRVQGAIGRANQTPRAVRASQLAEKLLQEAESLEREAKRLDSLDEGVVALPAVSGEATGQSRQAQWVKRQLDVRGWTMGGLTKRGDLDWHTSKRALDGLYVSPGSWKRIIDVLNKEPMDGRNIDIEEVPRTERPPRRKGKGVATPTPPETS
jgi:hypothetical protein